MNRKRRSDPWHFNMTPLIDVTFLLLTYFMLASHYASTEKPEIALPEPYESQARDHPLQEKVYVNVLFEGADQQPSLMFGPMRMDSLDELKKRLMATGKAAPQTQVVLRADRNVLYGQIRQVMEAVAAANLPNLQVVAVSGESEATP